MGGISDLAIRIGKSVSYITKRIKLLNLPTNVLDSITKDVLDVSVAEELFSIKDGNKQSALASLIADRRLSLRKARKLMKELNQENVDFDTFYKSEYSEHVKVAE